MDLTDQVAVFHLSAQGRLALKGLFPGGRSVEAFVVDMDERGAWLLIGRGPSGADTMSVPVTLLKWEYVAAVALRLKLGSAEAR